MTPPTLASTHGLQHRLSRVGRDPGHGRGIGGLALQLRQPLIISSIDTGIVAGPAGRGGASSSIWA